MTTLSLRGAASQQTFIAPPPIQGRITCRVCGLGAYVPLNHPALLCEPCLEDLDGTRNRVQTWLEVALASLDANQATWDAHKALSPAHDAWKKVQGALIGVAEKRVAQSVFDQTWQKRKTEGGPLAQLLEAYEVYARECDRIAAELARLHRAQVEINAAWLATEEPR